MFDPLTDALAGIDVAKESFQLAVQDPAEATLVNVSLPYTDDGLSQAIGLLARHKVTAVLLEATGGLERRLMADLAGAGLAVVRANPRQARDFAKAVGRLAKTDAIDAPTLALMLRRLRPQASPPPDAARQELSELATRRHQLVVLRTAEVNRLQQATLKLVQKDLRDHIAQLDRRVGRLEKQIADRIDADGDWLNKARLLDSAPGIGPTTAHALVAHLPEIGTLSDKQVAALAGLAPFNVDSGAFKGQRHIWGGRAAVRCALYMATLAATQFNPPIKAFYQRLIAKGKLFKVAITACMRKLLVILNAMVKNQTPWDEKLAAL